MSRQQRTRNTDTRSPKPKFQREREENQISNPVRPMNKKQRHYMELLATKDIIVATGFAGTSKTYLPTALACDALRLGHVERIIFSRPNISNSKSLGFFGGTLEEKMSNWLTPVLSVVRERMGLGGLEVALKHGDISYQPMETIKGLSVTNGWLILDEAEDLTIDEVKKVITRVGTGCKLVLAGDMTQSELKDNSGLKWLINFIEKHSLQDVIGHVDFNDPNEIVRSDTVRRIVVAMNRDVRGSK